MSTHCLADSKTLKVNGCKVVLAVGPSGGAVTILGSLCSVGPLQLP